MRLECPLITLSKVNSLSDLNVKNLNAGFPLAAITLIESIIKTMAIKDVYKEVIILDSNLFYCNRFSQVSWFIDIATFK